jgi:hypothetical protein
VFELLLRVSQNKLPCLHVLLQSPPSDLIQFRSKASIATTLKQEFLGFLKHLDRNLPGGLEVHLIADNYGTHKHPKVRAWLPTIRAITSTTPRPNSIAVPSCGLPPPTRFSRSCSGSVNLLMGHHTRESICPMCWVKSEHKDLRLGYLWRHSPKLLDKSLTGCLNPLLQPAHLELVSFLVPCRV